MSAEQNEPNVVTDLSALRDMEALEAVEEKQRIQISDVLAEQIRISHVRSATLFDVEKGSAQFISVHASRRETLIIRDLARVWCKLNGFDVVFYDDEQENG